MTALPDLSRLKPTGGKRSSKREQIVSVFLRQEGHLSADDLVDLIRREDHRISRATVYRTLQWMVDAGIARKVDFGEGRFSFEHSYRQPRHFHLICKTCSRSFEFLSSDIEALLEEVATLTARLGGTLAGEHGDGRLRAPLLETIWGPELAASFRAVKDAFDPLGILNPGVILPLPGQRPLDAIKYA